jgi:hypothetical protein
MRLIESAETGQRQALGAAWRRSQALEAATLVGQEVVAITAAAIPPHMKTESTNATFQWRMRNSGRG